MGGNNGENIFFIGKIDQAHSLLHSERFKSLNLSIILVSFDSSKSRARNTLAMVSITCLQANRKGVDVNCQK